MTEKQALGGEARTSDARGRMGKTYLLQFRCNAGVKRGIWAAGSSNTPRSTVLNRGQ